MGCLGVCRWGRGLVRIDVGLVLALSIGLGVAMLSAGDGLLSQCEELDSLLIEPRAWTPSGVVVRLAAPSGFSGCLHVVCTTNLSQTGWQLVHTTNVVGGGVVEWLDAAATNGDVAARFYELWNGDVDADHDGLSDCREARLFGTQRDNPDSDGDGIPDGAEVDEGSDPADAGSGLPSECPGVSLSWCRTCG